LGVLVSSQLEIFNAALIEVGSDPVTSPDQETERARVCLSRWDFVRDLVLREHPWKSARRRASLPAEGASPLFGWSASFAMPTDPYCLRVPEIDGNESGWTTEGRKILANSSGPINVAFVARVEPDQMDALLAHAVAMRLGAAIAFRLTQQQSNVDRMFKLYSDALRSARSVNATEGFSNDDESSSILDARR
jgi:hypothetical protein